MHSSWIEHVSIVVAMERVLRAPPARGGGDVLVILPSYGRPENLELAVQLALRCPDVGHVVVRNDHPDLRIADRIAVRHARLELIDLRRRTGPVGRYFEAQRLGAERCVSIDDDLFLPPAFLSGLVQRLREHPAIPHGVYGQRWNGRRFTDNLARFDGEVDLLNRVYAFTREHVARYFELTASLGLDLDDPSVSIALDDDVILGFCGASRPRIHDMGAFLDCPSERARGLARWRRPEAERVRRELFERLLAFQPRMTPCEGRARGPRRSRSRALLARLVGS